MQFRTLGKTGLKVSLVSYGSGGPSKLGQNTGLSPAEQDRLVQRCVDLGINLFDTSEAYGDSEVILGRRISEQAGLFSHPHVCEPDVWGGAWRKCCRRGFLPLQIAEAS